MMKVKAFIEQGSDGSYGIYLDDNDANILIIGEGNTLLKHHKLHSPVKKRVKYWSMLNIKPLTVLYCL